MLTKDRKSVTLPQEYPRHASVRWLQRCCTITKVPSNVLTLVLLYIVLLDGHHDILIHPPSFASRKGAQYFATASSPAQHPALLQKKSSNQGLRRKNTDAWLGALQGKNAQHDQAYSLITTPCTSDHYNL